MEGRRIPCAAAASGIVLVVLACARLPGESAKAPDRDRIPSVSETCGEGDRFASLDDLVSVFGTPVSDAFESLPNPHVVGQLDDHHVVDFRAAEARFIVLGAAPKVFLLQVLRVHSKGQEIRAQAWLGMALGRFFELAGPPYRSERETHFYACDETDELAVARRVSRQVIQLAAAVTSRGSSVGSTSP